jgi:hypothetical protein
MGLLSVSLQSSNWVHFLTRNNSFQSVLFGIVVWLLLWDHMPIPGFPEKSVLGKGRANCVSFPSQLGHEPLEQRPLLLCWCHWAILQGIRDMCWLTIEPFTSRLCVWSFFSWRQDLSSVSRRDGGAPERFCQIDALWRNIAKDKGILMNQCENK